MQFTTLAPAALLALIFVPAANAAPDAQSAPKVITKGSYTVTARRVRTLADIKPSTDADLISVLRQMEELLDMGQRISGPIQDLHKLVDRLPATNPEREAMSHAIDELEDRSNFTFVEPVDIGVIRKQFFWARWNASLESAVKTASANGQTVSQLASGLSPLTGGGLTVYIPRTARRVQRQMRDRFIHIEHLAATPDQFLHLVQLDVIQSRLQQWRQMINYRLRNLTVVRGNYEPVFRLLAARAQLLVASQFED